MRGINPLSLPTQLLFPFLVNNELRLGHKGWWLQRRPRAQMTWTQHYRVRRNRVRTARLLRRWRVRCKRRRR